MHSPLETRIAALRGRVRRLLALHGLARVVVAMVLAVVVACLADWLGHLVPEVRLAALAGVIGLCGWIAWRHVVTPLVVRFQDLDIAMRVERRWPGLNDRLSSTIQFVKARGRAQDDYLGSPALREATVAQTLREAESIDFREVVDPRPARKASLAAAGSIALGLALLAASPADGRLALRRLFAPYGGAQWPKSTELLAPKFAGKVAKGDPFTVEVAVRKGKTVPPSAQVAYVFDDGERSSEPMRPDGKGAFHARIDAVSRPFTFSVSAGDDRTPTLAVQVVPPPALKELAIRLTPPPYTGQAPASLAPGVSQIRGVEGTVVEIEALANKPIASALLHRGGSGPKAPTQPQAATIRGDGLRISSRFTIADSAPFWFSLVDTEPEAFTNREAARFEVRSIKDEAPRVVFEEPVGDREITVDGVLPLKIAADDDFGLQAIRLLFKIAASGSEATRSEVVGLWEPGTDQSAAGTRHQEVAYSWEMKPLELAPGTVITFHADARDLLPGPKGPNLGKSRELRLRIITKEEAAARLEEQRRAIRDEAERILAMQKTAITPVREAINTLDRTQKLDQPARDQIRTAESIQRQVSGRVASPNDGLDQKVRQFLQDLKNLKVENPDALAQMQALKDSVDRIKDNHLDPAEQGLARTNKALENADRTKADGDASKPQDDPKAGEPKADGGQQPGDKADARPGDKADAKSGDKADAKPGDKADANPAGDPKPGDKAGGDPKPGDDPKGGDKADAKPGDAKSGDKDKAGDKDQAAGKPGAKPPTTKDALAQAETHQKAIAEELQKMLDGMKELDTYQGVVKDAQKLLEQQQNALKDSAAAAADPALAGKNPDALSPRQKADRENAAARQNDIAKGLQALEQKMDDMAKRSDDADPLAAAALREAAAQSRQKGTVGKMGEGADQLAKNQMGSARSNQEQARQDLKELVQSIKDRREKELSRLAKALGQAGKDMDELRKKQAELLKKTREAGKNPDPKAKKEELQKLAREQAELEKELQKQLQRLKKLKADGAAQAGGKAAGKMDKAKKDLDDDDEDDAQKDQEEALADLEEARTEIEDKKREVEEQLAMEQLAKMKDTLKALKERQDKVVTDTSDYQKARAAREDTLTPGERVGVKGLARVQSGLKEETAALAERLEGAPVFALTLKRAIDNMDDAGKRLAAIKTDDDTQRAEKAAARRFEQLLDALKPDPPKPGQGGGDGPSGPPGPKGDGIPTAAQVKMLKMLQQEVNLRTEELDEIKERGKELSELQKGEVDRLQDEQGSIADLARDLTRPKKDDGEE